MFLHLCVILFTGGGGLCQGDPPGQSPLQTETPLNRDHSGQRPQDKDPLDRDPQTETPRKETYLG